MLCRTLDVVPEDERYLSSEKLDGWRALAAIVAGGVALRSREGHPVTAVPYINDALRALAPAGRILHGGGAGRSPCPRSPRRQRPPASPTPFATSFSWRAVTSLRSRRPRASSCSPPCTPST